MVLRDKRKTVEYFENYLAYQDTRIKEFSEVLTALATKDNADAERISQASGMVLGFLMDKFTAQYSYGSSLEELKNTFSQCLDYAASVRSLPYSEMVDVLSIAILLDIKDTVLFRILYQKQDDLIETLLTYLEKGKLDIHCEHGVEFPSIDGVFFNCLQGRVSPEELKNYLEEEWYDSHKDEAWYNSDKNDTDTYCGYWSYLGAAVIKMKAFDKAFFEDVKYIPKDLI